MPPSDLSTSKLQYIQFLFLDLDILYIPHKTKFLVSPPTGEPPFRSRGSWFHQTFPVQHHITNTKLRNGPLVRLMLRIWVLSLIIQNYSATIKRRWHLRAQAWISPILIYIHFTTLSSRLFSLNLRRNLFPLCLTLMTVEFDGCCCQMCPVSGVITLYQGKCGEKYTILRFVQQIEACLQPDP